jgi:hypothetical protein
MDPYEVGIINTKQRFFKLNEVLVPKPPTK